MKKLLSKLPESRVQVTAAQKKASKGPTAKKTRTKKTRATSKPVGKGKTNKSKT
jgi:hypothetical protein